MTTVPFSIVGPLTVITRAFRMAKIPRGKLTPCCVVGIPICCATLAVVNSKLNDSVASAMKRVLVFFISTGGPPRQLALPLSVAGHAEPVARGRLAEDGWVRPVPVENAHS